MAKPVWRTRDGLEFSSEDAALAHEETLDSRREDAHKRILRVVGRHPGFTDDQKVALAELIYASRHQLHKAIWPIELIHST